MFFRRTFAFILFGMLLVFGLFGLRQRSTFNRGYAQGFAAAQQTAAQESAETAGAAESVQPPPQARGWGYFPFLGIVGFFFKFWLLLFFFGFTMKLLGFGRHRRWHRRRGCGPGGRRHWQHRHKDGHDDDEAPYEKQPEDVEPDIRHA